MTRITTFALAALLIVAAPSFSLAATYAYVNQSGEVSSVVADNANVALATAPNIHAHSGVMIIDSPEDQALVD